MSHQRTLRPAGPADVGTILGFIRELAAYEKLSHEVVATEDLLREQLFSPGSNAGAVLVCEHDRPVGYALYFHNFSTFLGRRGLYLEDLYVQPAVRGRGHGKALLQHLAALARERGCGRFEWTVLDWNEPAIRFYRSQGAEILPEWRICRVTGPALERLATPVPGDTRSAAER